MKPVIEMLQTWSDKIKASDAEIDRLLDPLGLVPESPMYALVWGLQAVYTDAVAVAVGDEGEWLLWYRHENEMGQKGYGCCPGTGHASRKINNVADLAQLIAESK